MCRKWHTLFLPKKNQRHSSSSSGLSTRPITTFLSSLLLSFSSAPHILLLPHSSHGFKIFISVHLLHSDHPSSSTLGRVIASPAIANHPSCPSTATFYLREIRCQPGNFVDAKKGISIWKGDWENLHFHIASYNNLPFPTTVGLTFSAAGFACPGKQQNFRKV